LGSSAEDARLVCNVLGIKHFVLDLRADFSRSVIEPFVREYCVGLTPNPCINCNRFIKWRHLNNFADLHNADFIATGHYAEIKRDPRTNRLTVKSADSAKDQSYSLYTMPQEILERAVFPIGSLSKEKVREIARREFGLKASEKPDSQDICFLPGGNHAGFIKDYLGQGRDLSPGNFVDVKGNVLGPHKGIGFYTTGQRKGLGGFGVPMYVLGINHGHGTSDVILTPDEEDLFSDTMTVGDLSFMSHAFIDGHMECLGKIRYAHKAALCVISQQDDGKGGSRILCTFKEPQRAVTPGQSAVFYDFDGGIICGGVIV
jgi:tRNA-specific 2-thiouridylase